MTEVLHADIFFLITSVAVVAVSATFLIALYYAIGILRDARAIMAQVRRASAGAEEDFEVLRAEIKAEGAKARALMDLFAGFVVRWFRGARRRKRNGL